MNPTTEKWWNRNHAVAGATSVPEPGAQDSRDGGPASDKAARVLLLLIIALICAVTWRKWGNLSVDCGREMYIPAILSQGKRLYFDAWYMYGPLIPYWHAALFRLLGIHLGVLIGAGVSLVVIIAMLLYSVSRVFLPVWLSFACVLAFLLQAFQLNIFNYILPYSYGAAYGAMFSVLLLWLLLRRGSEFTWRYVVVLGFVASLMMLTKVEFGAAGYAGIACAIVVQSIRKKSLRGLAAEVCACIPGTLLWLGIYGWYVHAGGADFFLGDNLSILPNSYFVKHFGKLWNTVTGLTLAPAMLAKSVAIGLAGFGTLAACVVLAARSRRLRWVLLAAAVGICGMHAVAKVALKVFHKDVPLSVFDIVPFVFFNTGMVWVCLVVLVMAAADWWRGDHPAKQQSTIMLCAIAMACGMRVLTQIQPGQRPIFFDTLVYLVWLVGLYEVSKRFSVDLDGRLGKILAGVLCVSILALTFNYYPVHQRSYRVSTARGTLFATPSVGKPFSQVLAFMENAKRLSQEVVVMPEDTGLYYLSGTVAPSRWYIVTGQVLPPGETTARYVEELERANIRYVILSDRAIPEYGIPVFGVDYGLQISAWLQENYRVVQRIGNYEAVAEPKEWGVLIYERKTIGANR
jgi:hypothetical protein